MKDIIFHLELHHGDKDDCYMQGAKYTLTRELLSGRMEREKTKMFSKAGFAMSTSQRRITELLQLDQGFPKGYQLQRMAFSLGPLALNVHFKTDTKILRKVGQDY